MKTVTLIIGLPGSGKTHLGKELTEISGVFLDDPKDKQHVTQYLNKYDYLVIADPWLCLEKQREACVKLLTTLCPEVIINYIYFENDPASCEINLNRRKAQGDQRIVQKDLTMFHQGYTIPLEAETKPVYKDENDA